MRIIPAIDLLDGEVVRLTKGDYNEKQTYGPAPLEQALLFLEAGFNRIHVVDLNGAKSGRFENLDLIRRMASEPGLSVQTGGGVRSLQQIEQLLDAGLDGVICSSMAVKQPEEWLKAVQRWPEKMILGMDLREGQISWSGWLKSEEIDREEFLRPMIDAGLRQVLSTDISRDGTLQGPNLNLYEELRQAFPELNWIASGGVSSKEDLVGLNRLGLFGVVVGKAYYEGHVSLEQLAAFHRGETPA